MRRKNRPAPSQQLATGTAERLAAIVEAAERAAVAVIDDAEKQAQRHLEEAQAEADRLVSERLDSLGDMTDSLIAQAESIRNQSEQLLSTLQEAKRRLAIEDGAIEFDGAEAGEPAPASHLTAVAPLEEAASTEDEPAEPGRPAAGRGTPAGARLLATQMAVSGNSREEIEARLRNGFEIEDAASILDAILGPEE